MSRVQVFNHHSLPYDASSQAIDAVPEFLKLCLKAKGLGFDTVLLDETQDASWFRIELAPGYFFQDWFHNAGKLGANREDVTAFRSIATKTPLFAPEDLDNGLDLFEVKETSSSIEYSALRAAAWLEAPMSSFPTRPPWNRNPIPVTVTTLDETEEHQVGRDITNWYSVSVLEKMADILRNERDVSIRSGMDLWERKNTLFPLLSFCGKAVSQLQLGLHTQTIVGQVCESLHFLNLFAEKWQSGEILQYTHSALRSIGMPHEVSGEKETVRNDPRLRKAREFWLDCGEKAFFENHIKLSAGYRIHFYLESKGHRIHVGYIGSHLSTARYK